MDAKFCIGTVCKHSNDRNSKARDEMIELVPDTNLLVPVRNRIPFNFGSLGRHSVLGVLVVSWLGHQLVAKEVLQTYDGFDKSRVT